MLNTECQDGGGLLVDSDRGVAVVRSVDATGAGSPRAAVARSPAQQKLRIINLIVVVLPLLGLIAAMVLSWGVAFNWVHLAVMLGVGAVSSFGITVGFHRLCTHRSFKTPPLVRYLFAAAGSMAVQGPVIWWCGEHRRHHQHSDTEGDPH